MVLVRSVRLAVAEGSPDVFRVAGLWRYLVKSLGGEPVEASQLGQHGLPGDRAFGIVEVGSGKVLTARREPRLLFATASWHDGEVEIVAAGQRLAGSASTLTRRCRSGWVARSVSPVPDRKVACTRLLRTSNTRPGGRRGKGRGYAWHDSGRTCVSLVSSNTLRGWEPERFRVNVLLDEGEDEDALVGRQVQLGTALLEVTKRIDRCVMVTRAQPDVPADPDVLRTIRRENDGCFALGALVGKAGDVAVGDRLISAG